MRMPHLWFDIWDAIENTAFQDLFHTMPLIELQTLRLHFRAKEAPRGGTWGFALGFLGPLGATRTAFGTCNTSGYNSNFLAIWCTSVKLMDIGPDDQKDLTVMTVPSALNISSPVRSGRLSDLKPTSEYTIICPAGLDELARCTWLQMFLF